jgi:hypothetical protein
MDDFRIGKIFGKVKILKLIKKTDKNYTPSNCRWVSRKINSNNTRRCKRYSIGGEFLTITEMSDKYGINKKCLAKRINLGWNLSEAVFTPSGSKVRYTTHDRLTNEDLNNLSNEWKDKLN